MKWNVFLSFVVLVIAAFAPMAPSSTWATAGSGQPSGAPAVYAGSDQLGNARRAAIDAGAQASFLTQGTKQLREGTDKLQGGSDELAAGIKAANDGAQQLSQGMVQLQAGTGQLATSATQLADTVGGAVDQVVGFEAVRGQILAAIDDTLKSTRNSRDPQVVDLRNQLTGLRQQVETAQIPADFTTQLNELKNGSRELANQLATPGYAYHDGVYTATNGASELAKGLSEMNGQVGEATGGIKQLVDGAAKIDDMANTTKQDIAAVQRALPAAAPAAGAARTAEGAPVSSIPPLAAMLVSALAILGGAATALAAYASRNRWAALAAGTVFTTAAGLILVAILGTNLGAMAIALSALALALATLASASVTWIMRADFGRIGGAGAAGVFALVQMGVVGWVWSTAAAGDVSLAWRAASSALPMHWSTAAISSAGNHGSATAMWVGIGLSALLALIGLAAVLRSDSTVLADDGEDEYAPASDADTFSDADTDTAVLEADGEIEHGRKSHGFAVSSAL